MNHQPYENWILDSTSQTEQNKLELAQHLSQCPECSRLLEGWHTVERTMNKPQVQPAPANFTHRWQINLIKHKQEQERKQTRVLLYSLLGSTLLVILFAGIVFLPGLSLVSLVAGFISTVTSIISGVENLWSFIFNLAQSVSPTTLFITIAIVSGWVLLACFTLGLSIWKLAFKRGVNKS